MRVVSQLSFASLAISLRRCCCPRLFFLGESRARLREAGAKHRIRRRVPLLAVFLRRRPGGAAPGVTFGGGLRSRPRVTFGEPASFNTATR